MTTHSSPADDNSPNWKSKKQRNPSDNDFQEEPFFAAEIPAPLQRVFAQSLTMQSSRESCRFLERHLALLDPSVLAFYERRINEYQEAQTEKIAEATDLHRQIPGAAVQATEETQRIVDTIGELRQILKDLEENISILRPYCGLLREAIAAGGTVEAVRQAAVNQYGGLVLDVPHWLQAVESDHFKRIQAGQQGSPTRDRWSKALERSRREHLPPEVQAEIMSLLAQQFSQATGAEQAIAQEEAIALMGRVTEIYTLARYPRQWAIAQFNLGLLFTQRLHGDHAQNWEAGLNFLESVLQAVTSEQEPRLWSEAHASLGRAYHRRILGDPAQNEAAALVHLAAARAGTPRDVFPHEWAVILIDLGDVYLERTSGERSQNSEKAIDLYTAALSELTAEDDVVQWAQAQENLGVAFLQRQRADPTRDIEQAIACSQSVLHVVTLSAQPDIWASAHYNLGRAYAMRRLDSLPENQELAKQHLQQALQVFSPTTHALNWAQIQFQLGKLFYAQDMGKKAEYLERALTCFENAERVLTRATAPQDWAIIQHYLGVVSLDLLRGDRSENIEQAIAHLEASLQMRAQVSSPIDWAEIQNSLGNAYAQRRRGEWRDNEDKAIASYLAALEIWNRDNAPLSWAMVQANLGNAYRQKLYGNRSRNIESAIDHFRAASAIYTQEATPQQWATLQNNLGNAFAERFEGEKAENLERAIGYYQAALRVYTQDIDPLSWAATQQNLGNAYAALAISGKQASLLPAIRCYDAALSVFAQSVAPHQQRRTLISKAEASMEFGQWQLALEAYNEAFQREQQLLALATGPHDQDRIIREGADTGLRAGFALARLGQVEAAMLQVERSRARALKQARALAVADPQRISDPHRRKRYLTLREQLRHALNAVHEPPAVELAEQQQRARAEEHARRARMAQEQFTAMLDEIQRSQDPADFLLDTAVMPTIEAATQRGGPSHALLYMLTTPWGGMALIAAHGRQPEIVDLPTLTTKVIEDLVERQPFPGAGYALDGFGHAQIGDGFSMLMQDWPGDTFSEKALRLHDACTTQGRTSALDAAAQELIQYAAPLANTPIEQLSSQDLALLKGTLRHLFLSYSLHDCLSFLGEHLLRPLWHALVTRALGSVTLIPCGLLATFPLLTAPVVGESDPATWSTFSDLLPATIAPSARSLVLDDPPHPQRAGVAALGDPDTSLAWGEAEAYTVAKLARLSGLKGTAKVQRQATRSWLLEQLRHAQVIDASCHGKADTADYLRSHLVLADGTVTLGEILAGQVPYLQGLRLLILSACETAVLDLRSAPDEVRSLTTGFLQAGAAAVMGAAWAVDDKATYLLIVRFAQIWLPMMQKMPPAQALAQAQHWLRTCTNGDLHRWVNTALADREQAIPSVRAAQRYGEALLNDDPFRPELTVAGLPIVAVRGEREPRMDIKDAQIAVNQNARQQAEPHARPYADPVFWAGFQVMGW